MRVQSREGLHARATLQPVLPELEACIAYFKRPRVHTNKGLPYHQPEIVPFLQALCLCVLSSTFQLTEPSTRPMFVPRHPRALGGSVAGP